MTSDLYDTQTRYFLQVIKSSSRNEFYIKVWYGLIDNNVC